MERTVDVAVLGGGTGGYVAALRAAQAGQRVIVIERDRVGGTCLHRGCIPSKAMLHSAALFASARDAERFGVQSASVTLDFARVANHRDEVVHRLHQGVQQLLKKHSVEIIRGTGRFAAPSIFSPTSGAIAVSCANGETATVHAGSVILATGSRPRTIPGVEVDGATVVTSDQLIQSTSLPASMLILGGGVIGVEWASMFADFGCKVTVVEAMDRVLPMEDASVSRAMAASLKTRGVALYVNSKVTDISVQNGGAVVSVETPEGERLVDAQQVLVSVGRVPNTEDLGLEATDVRLRDGFVEVDAHMRTHDPRIFAIGDMTRNPQLAHVAMRQGMIAADTIAGRETPEWDSRFVARCMYGSPEIGCAGLTEEAARASGRAIKTGVFPMRALGRALLYGETDGFVKIVADADNDDLLGVHIVGPRATDLVSEAGLGLLLNASLWEFGAHLRPHPSFAEALSEAALLADGLGLHV